MILLYLLLMPSRFLIIKSCEIQAALDAPPYIAHKLLWILCFVCLPYSWENASMSLQAGLLQTAFIILSGLLLWGIRTPSDDGYSLSFWEKLRMCTRPSRCLYLYTIKESLDISLLERRCFVFNYCSVPLELNLPPTLECAIYKCL